MKGIKSILFSFNCGHGVVPDVAKELNDRGLCCVLILSTTQPDPDDLPPNCDILRISPSISEWPDTDERRLLGVLTGRRRGYRHTVILDDNISISVDSLLKMVQLVPDGVIGGCVLEGSNSHVRKINEQFIYYERGKDYPATAYPERTIESHTEKCIKCIEEPSILEPEHDESPIPIGMGGIYKIQVVDTHTYDEDILRHLFPTGEFEPWQDMWMMVWAWWYKIPIYKFHGISYKRVIYNTEEPRHRVRGRTIQTIDKHIERIKPSIQAWPQMLLEGGVEYLKHRGSCHYLKI